MDAHLSVPRPGRLAVLTCLWLLSAVAFFAPEVDGPGVDVPGADKAVHVVVFATLTAAARWCFGMRRRVLGALVGYGIVVEAVQGLFIAGRGASVLDVVADAAGIALAVWTGHKITRWGRGGKATP